MRSRRTSRLSRVGALMLIGGLLLMNGSLRVASAASPTTEEILAKVNEVLAAIGGIKDGNHTPRWDQNLPAAQRFVILPAFNNEAVLDKNTGLVWEKSPGTTIGDWRNTRVTCANKNVGGLKGWRLPSIAELLSLVDPSMPSPGPTLPPGHPFLNVQSSQYWSATTLADDSTIAWRGNFREGIVGAGSKDGAIPAWCVRGGMNTDQY